MTKSAEIKSGSYVRINSWYAQPTPIAVGVNGVVIDRDRQEVTFTLADNSEVTALLTAEALKWAEGCPTNSYSTRMEMLYLAEKELTLESVTFRRPVFVADCPVPPIVITLREAGDETGVSLDASGCQWWAGAKCIYFGQDYATLRGQIVDFETRGTIQDAEAVFVAPTGSQIYPATFQVVLPGGAQVRLEVSAPGYAPSVGRIESHGDKVVVSHGPGPLSEGAPFEILELRDPRDVFIVRPRMWCPAGSKQIRLAKEVGAMKSLNLVLVLVVLFTLIGGAAPALAAASTNPHGGVSNPCGEFYYVRWGDTLAKIAARCNSTVAILLRANPQVANPDRIYVGQRLNILPRGTHVPVFRQVKIYLIGLGNVPPCGTPVARVLNVRPTTAPLTAAIQELITIGEYHGESGLYNPLDESNLSIQTVTLVNGKATIRLTGTLRVNGAFHGCTIKTVFDRTALQFSTVKSVAVFINGRPLIDILSEEP